MLAVDFFQWWFGHGWRATAQRVEHGFKYILAVFSFTTLSRTLFAPWRRIISYPGASFDDKLRAVADNIFSRAIGFVIRLSVLIVASICFLLWGVIGSIILLCWPFVPLGVPVALLLGIIS